MHFQIFDAIDYRFQHLIKEDRANRRNMHESGLTGKSQFGSDIVRAGRFTFRSGSTVDIRKYQICDLTIVDPRYPTYSNISARYSLYSSSESVSSCIVR